MLGDASMVDVVSPYFARAMGRDTLPPILQANLRAWWLGAAQAGGTNNEGNDHSGCRMLLG